MQQTLITPAKYAELRGLNRSTISRQVASGAIPAHDGLVDPAEADRARDHNLNQARRAQAAQVKALKKARPERRKRPAGQKPAANSSHDAIVATVREITAPSEVLMFARAALEVGCTPLQVYVLANRLMIQPCLVPEQVTVEDLCDFAEPTDAQWRALLGADFDFLAADAEHDRVVHQVEGGGKTV